MDILIIVNKFKSNLIESQYKYKNKLNIILLVSLHNIQFTSIDSNLMSIL